MPGIMPEIMSGTLLKTITAVTAIIAKTVILQTIILNQITEATA